MINVGAMVLISIKKDAVQRWISHGVFLCLFFVSSEIFAASAALSLWQKMAISANASESFPFVMTDNRAGYFEGKSFRYNDGVGYRYREQSLLRDCVSFADDHLLDRRTQSIRATLLPFSIRHDYPHVQETTLIHSGQSIVSCKIESDHAVDMTVAVSGLFERSYDIIQRGKITLIKARKTQPKGVPSYVSITASEQFDIDAQLVVPEQEDVTPLLAFRSRVKTQQLIVQFAFAESAGEALKLAQQAIVNQRWEQEEKRRYRQLSQQQFLTDDDAYNKALWWAHASAQSFVVKQFGSGIWAGLPWFRENWGRDTFIALPGTSLVNGDFRSAKKIIENFWRYQFLKNKQSPLYGRIPNRVSADSDIIYNTVDGTPWLIRELYEYVLYSGDVDFALKHLPHIDAYIDGVSRHWLDRYGLLTHGDADTWMDARIENKEAWSPRGNRAVEIQVLWMTVLDVAIQLHRFDNNSVLARRYQLMLKKTRDSFNQLFWQDQMMADRLRPDDSRDLTMRPNQLMTISIPFTPIITSSMQTEIVRNVARELFLPYGVLSLSPSHPAFHPLHQNEQWHHKDAAYHNGTIWGWNSGFAITALTREARADLAWQMSRHLTQQILTSGYRGTMSELVDATLTESGAVQPSGTYAQAWSVAEFVRNAYQDYLGFHPNMLNATLYFSPAIPPDWSTLTTRLRFGKNASVIVNYQKVGEQQRWVFTPQQAVKNRVIFRLRSMDRYWSFIEFDLAKNPVVLVWDGQRVLINNEDRSSALQKKTALPDSATIDFRTPLSRDFSAYPTLQQHDQLKQRIISGEKVF